MAARGEQEFPKKKAPNGGVLINYSLFLWQFNIFESLSEKVNCKV